MLRLLGCINPGHANANAIAIAIAIAIANFLYSTLPLTSA